MRIDKQKLELAKARACMETKDIVAAGVPRGTLCKATRENVKPITAGKIAKALGVDVSEILDDSEGG